MRNTLLLCTALMLVTSGCTYLPDQNRYNNKEVGVSSAITLATVLSVHDVKITPQSTGIGMLAGGGSGALAGSAASGGNAWATAGGALGGAIGGSLVELALQDRDGLEYIIRTDSGELKSVVQEKDGDETKPFKKGDRVMLQTCDPDPHARCTAGKAYQRLVPIPPELADIKAPPAKPKHHKKKSPPPPTDDTASASDTSGPTVADDVGK